MTDKIFAPNTPRDDQGRYLFPDDQQLRRDLLHPDAMSHPGKNNMHLVAALVDYITEPGDVILDPFGGVGSMFPAVEAGRDLILIELEPTFANMLRHTAGEFGHTQVIQQDCRVALPIACDHAIFSPPFANSITSFDMTANKALEYSTKGLSNTQNLGLLNEFLFVQAMNKIYRLLADSVKQGGRLAIITRDSAAIGATRAIARGVIKGLNRAGFHYDEWIIRKVGESLRARYNRQQGAGVNEDEDILLFTKE